MRKAHAVGLAGLFGVSAMCAACGGEGGGVASGLKASAGTPSSGSKGASLEGTSLDGVRLNWSALGIKDVTLDSISLNSDGSDGSSGVSVRGIPVTDVSLIFVDADGNVSNQLNGFAGEQALSGKDFTDARMMGRLSNGSLLGLRIEGVVRGLGANSDLYYYNVSYKTPWGWLPLCGQDPFDGPVLALPVSGTWNHGQGVLGGGSYSPDGNEITFACSGRGAIAACVEAGYKPWKQAQTQKRRIDYAKGEPLPEPETARTLADELQACTRMVRADYCGDGTAWSLDRTWVNAVDSVRVNSEWNEWAIEAEWSAKGARCTSSLENARFNLMSAEPPSCFLKRLRSDCGSVRDFERGTLIIEQYDGTGQFAHPYPSSRTVGEMTTDRPLMGQIEFQAL